MPIHYKLHQVCAVITIDRPERRNALDRDAAQALAEAFRRFEADEEAQVAILTGAGSHFCAGADLNAVSEGPAQWLSETGDGPMGPTRMMLSKPVIAAIEGYAVAGGLELALWCDLRVAAQSATFGVFCRRFGVPLIDGGTVRLPRLIGQSRALDMILTGRPVPADEALEFGLANRVCPDGKALETAIGMAVQIAAFPQTCLRHDRQSVYEQWDMTPSGAMLNETRLGQATLDSGETVEGATRFKQGEGRHGAFD